MAKIFAAFYSATQKKNTLICYYDMLFNGLKKAGNELLVAYTNTFGRDFSGKIPQELLHKIKNFDPDIFIFFDNYFYDISKITDKPIIIYDVDSPYVFSNPENIKENVSRYKFVTFQSDMKSVIQKRFGASEKNVFFFPPVTEVHCDNSVMQNKDIVFIGTNFPSNFSKVISFANSNPNIFQRQKALHELKCYKDNWYMNDFSDKNRASIFSQDDTLPLTGMKRLEILNEVSELGLHLFGIGWKEIHMAHWPKIVLSAYSRQIVSLKENQNIYNSSKIGLNINHIQATSGMSWRVCDIMASNAVLVSEVTRDMKLFFPNLPFGCYASKREAYEQCKRLLESETMRVDLAGRCQEEIDRKHRFRHLLSLLEERLQIDLHDTNNSGSLELLEMDNLQTVKELIRAGHPVKAFSYAKNVSQDYASAYRYLWRYGAEGLFKRMVKYVRPALKNQPDLSKVCKKITTYVPGNICNLRCSYCYVSQCQDPEHLVKPHFDYPVEYMVKAFTPQRLGGIAEFTVIGAGETLIPEEVIPFIHGLLRQGHIVEVVSNLTLSDRIDKLLDTSPEDLKRLIVKGSLHWVELKRLNKVNEYFNNMRKILSAGASSFPFFVAGDLYMPYLDEIRQHCLAELNALPHCSPCMAFEEKTDMGEFGKVMTSPVCDSEFRTLIEQKFQSKLFQLCADFIDVNPRKYFCNAGKWSFVVNLSDGGMSKCHNCKNDFNLFSKITSAIPEKPIGYECKIASCCLQYDFISLGLLKDFMDYPTYGKLLYREGLINEDLVEKLDFKFSDQI